MTCLRLFFFSKLSHHKSTVSVCMNTPNCSPDLIFICYFRNFWCVATALTFIQLQRLKGFSARNLSDIIRSNRCKFAAVTASTIKSSMTVGSIMHLWIPTYVLSSSQRKHYGRCRCLRAVDVIELWYWMLLSLVSVAVRSVSRSSLTGASFVLLWDSHIVDTLKSIKKRDCHLRVRNAPYWVNLHHITRLALHVCFVILSYDTLRLMSKHCVSWERLSYVTDPQMNVEYIRKQMNMINYPIMWAYVSIT